jgi:hypothetical protein
VTAPSPAPDPPGAGFLDYQGPPADPQRQRVRITYRFANAASLDRWLVAHQRLALIEESGALLIAAPVEQRVVEPRRDRVTLVSSVGVPFCPCQRDG